VFVSFTSLANYYSPLSRALYAKELLLRYLPSIGFGFILTFLLVYTFELSSSHSPLLDYLNSNPELNANSSEWFLFMLYDSVIPLFLTAITVTIYRKVLPNYPFDFLVITLIQLPVTIVFIRINGIPSRFGSAYESATSIATIVASTSVLLVFMAIIAFKAFKRTKNS